MVLLALLAAGLALAARIAIAQRDDAIAAQVLAQAASLPDRQIDTRLLVGAEALRRYPDRLEARLRVLEQLARAADQRALLRIGFAPVAWVRSRDGRSLVTAGGSGELAVLSLSDWRVHSQAGPGGERRDQGLPIVALSPDASTLILAGDSGWTVRRLVDGMLQPGIRLKVPRELESSNRIGISPDNRHLLATSHFGTWVWPLDGAAATPRRLADRQVVCMAFSADGSRVRLVEEAASTEVELARGAPVATRVPGDLPHAHSADCHRVATVEERAPGSHVVIVRDGLSRELLTELVGPIDTGKPMLSFSADGRFVGVVTPTTVGVWSAETGVALWQTGAPHPRVMDAPFFSDSLEWVAIEVGDPPMYPRRLQVFDARTGAQVLDVPSGLAVDDAVFGTQGDSVLPMGLYEQGRGGRPVDVWHLGHRDRLTRGGAVYRASAVDLTVRPGVAVTTTKDLGGLDVWDTSAGSPRLHASLERPGVGGGPPWLSADFETDLGGSPFSLYNSLLDSRAPVGRFTPGRTDAGPRAAAASADGSVHAVGMRDGTVHVIERGMTDPEVIVVSPTRAITALAIRPDRRMMAVGSVTGEVSVLDRTPGRAVRGLHRHGSAVTRIAFDADAGRVASLAEGGNLIVQQVDGGTPAVRVGQDQGEGGRLHFLGKGPWLVVGDAVWDVERRVPVADFGASGTRLAAVVLSPTTDEVAWQFADGSLRFGRWHADALRGEVCAIVVRNLECDEWRRHFGTEPYRRTCNDLPAPVCDVPR